jgi:hypothetical protein
VVVEVVAVALTAAERPQVEATAAEMPDRVAGMPASAAATVELAEPRSRAQLQHRVQQLERAHRPQPLVRQLSPEQLRLQPVETAVEAVAEAVLPCKFDSPRRRVSIPLL